VPTNPKRKANTANTIMKIKAKGVNANTIKTNNILSPNISKIIPINISMLGS